VLMPRGVALPPNPTASRRGSASTRDLLDESRSPYHPMRVSKVRSLRSRELNGKGAVLDFVGRAAFSTQGAKVMSSRPNIEALHVEEKSVGARMSFKL
jgi:hypothetical protein